MDNNSSQMLSVSSSPHVHCGENTAVIMQDVIIALVPASIISVVYFGWRAAMLIAICVTVCILTEYICRKIMKRPQTIGDFSAAVTGLLLALNLPPTLNPIYAVLGSVFAIVVVKQMFGGIGMNFVNPALAARIFLLVSFSSDMSSYVIPFYYLSNNAQSEALTTATPLAQMAAGEQSFSLMELFIGMTGGCIGETCALLLILGGIYLLIRRVITIEIPLSFLLTAAIISVVLGENPLYQILSGGMMIGAIFMATDYTTSPITRKGKIIYGAGCGAIAMIIRHFGSLPEGVSYAIIIMNILTPHIDAITKPKPFGMEAAKDGK